MVGVELEVCCYRRLWWKVGDTRVVRVVGSKGICPSVGCINEGGDAESAVTMVGAEFCIVK